MHLSFVVLFRASVDSSKNFCFSTDDKNLPDGYEVYDVIDEDGVAATTGQRDLPPLPTNHDQYTRLNHEYESTQQSRKVNQMNHDYESFVNDADSVSPAADATQTGPIGDTGPSRQHAPSTENVVNVDGLGREPRTNVGVVYPTQRKDKGLDERGYLVLQDVPSPDYLRKVGEEMECGSGDPQDGLDALGYLQLQDVPSPERVRNASLNQESSNNKV